MSNNIGYQGVIAGIICSLAGCSAQVDPSLNAGSSGQTELRDVFVPEQIPTCGLYGAANGYRQYQLACLNFTEDEIAIGPEAPCPASISRNDENNPSCGILRALGDTNNGQWDGVVDTVIDCSICAYYSEDPANHPRKLGCSDPANQATGLFSLDEVTDRVTNADGRIQKAWLLLFQSTHGVRGVVCENENPAYPGRADCTVDNPEVAGYFDANGTLHLTKYEYIRDDKTKAVIEVIETPLFEGAKLKKFAGQSDQPSPDFYASENAEIGSLVLVYEGYEEFYCAPAVGPSA